MHESSRALAICTEVEITVKVGCLVIDTEQNTLGLCDWIPDGQRALANELLSLIHGKPGYTVKILLNKYLINESNSGILNCQNRMSAFPEKKNNCV